MDSLYENVFRSEELKDRFIEAYKEKEGKWPVPFESKYVKTSYGETYVRISGETSLPPLILLHGAGNNSLTWAPNIEAFSKKYHTYAVDNIWENTMSLYSRPIENVGDYMNWLDELLDALEIQQKVCMVGMSYGGWLTANYTLHNPDRLRKVVFIAPPTFVIPNSAEFIARVILVLIPSRYILRSFFEWLFDDLIKSGPEGVQMTNEFIDDAVFARKAFNIKKMVNPTVFSETQLQGIEVPSLYIVGENEKNYSAKKALNKLSLKAPNIHTKLIEGAGHDLTLLKTITVNKAILDFLE
jgi:pimeloyl-ACP methyl ester carboxylesterase